MKKFLIGSFILAFLFGATPALAERDYRQEGLTKVGGPDRDGPHHKKFLTSRYNDNHYRGGHKSRGYDRKGHGGWRGHPGRDKHWKNGWKRDKWHHRKHRYHGHKRHWNKHRYDRRHHDGYRYRFRYNGVLGADGGPAVSGGQIMIDLSR